MFSGVAKGWAFGPVVQNVGAKLNALPVFSQIIVVVVLGAPRSLFEFHNNRYESWHIRRNLQDHLPLL